MDLSKRAEDVKHEYAHLIRKDKTISRFLEWSNDHDMNEVGLQKVWNRNAEVNFQMLDKPEIKDRYVGSIHQLLPHKQKAAIYVGRGPSLMKAWEMLKEADRDKFVVICTNSSLRFLLEHDIVPDYMICIDGRQRMGYWSLKDLPEKANLVEAWLSISVDPHAFRYWPGPIRVISMGNTYAKIKRRINKRFGANLPGGGNAFNQAVCIMLWCSDIKMHLFVGNDLSYGDQHYGDQKTQRDERVFFTTPNIYGETVKTEIPFWIYKTWMESAIQQFWPDHTFINCSEGILGLDPNGEPYPFLDHMPLDMAIDKVKEALEIEALPFNEKSKMMYTEAYHNAGYNPTGGIRNWENFRKQFDKNETPFKKGLDVGCGSGISVEIARKGGHNLYGCDIADIKDIWKEKGVDKYCTTCPADNMPYKDNEFDLVTCTEVMEHIPEDYIDATLQEIYRVCSDTFIFSIHTALERQPLKGYYQLHFTVKDGPWWVNKFEENGFIIHNWVWDKKAEDIGIYAYKNRK